MERTRLQQCLTKLCGWDVVRLNWRVPDYPRGDFGMTKAVL